MSYIHIYKAFHQALTKYREILILHLSDQAHQQTSDQTPAQTLDKALPSTQIPSTQIPSAQIPSAQILSAQIQQLKQIAQTPHSDLAGLSPRSAQQLEAFQVEINKQLKLLGVDCLFLQTAKQPQTLRDRLSQMQTRLELLERYCEGILALENISEK
jgi:hypothetical protein